MLTRCFLVCILALTAHAVPTKLGSFKIDPNGVTVSGISSGAAMASQLAVAYSATFTGHGSVAGRKQPNNSFPYFIKFSLTKIRYFVSKKAPYYCASGSMMTATTTCMSGFVGTVNVNNLVSKMINYKSSGLIDDPAYLKSHKVYIYSGTLDSTVRNS
jgi:hypothetical protein